MKLARHLQTKKLNAGEILFDENSKDEDFYVVVDGSIQIFLTGRPDELQRTEYLNDADDEWFGHHLLHEVGSGGTVSSLFTILSLLTRDFKLPCPLVDLERSAPTAEIPSTEHVSVSEPADVSPGSDAIPIFIDKEAALTESPSIFIAAETADNSQNLPESSTRETVFPHLNSTATDRKFSSDSSAKKSKSVHPQLVARAAKATSLAVIPAQAFRKLTEMFPNAAAHISQVILTRFQRVTFLTLYRYLGLSKELLGIEQRVNEIAGYGLPISLFPKRANMASDHEGDWHPNHSENHSLGDILNRPFFVDSPTGDERYHFVDDEDVRDSVFKCIAHLIGMTPTVMKEKTGPSFMFPTHKYETGKSKPPLGSSAVERFYYSTHKSGSKGSHSQSHVKHKTRKPSYLDADDLSTASRTSHASSGGDAYSSDDQVDTPDVQIRVFHQGEVLIKEGQRNSGLYLVLEGTLAASTTPKQSFGLKTGRTAKSPLFKIGVGGLAGYLAALTGNTSFVTITAYTDVTVGFMPKDVLDRYVVHYPNILLCLAKRLLNQLSPLVLHIDFALEWGQMNAGQVLCRQGEQSHSIFIVLTGRLRALTTNESGNVELKGEYGHSESIGEMEVLMDINRQATVHAIRDSEVAILPKTLFNALAIQHPEIMLTIAKIIAVRSNEVNRRISLEASSGSNNENLKTVCLLPTSAEVPLLKFSELLLAALQSLGPSVVMLDNAAVTKQLGKHAFTKLGRLKLVSWLAEQEETHGLVIYVADGGPSSLWTQRCVRQADCILLIAIGDSETSVGEYERMLIGMKTTARKELVLLHPRRSVPPGMTSRWLKNRPWYKIR